LKFYILSPAITTLPALCVVDPYTCALAKHIKLDRAFIEGKLIYDASGVLEQLLDFLEQRPAPIQPWHTIDPTTVMSSLAGSTKSSCLAQNIENFCTVAKDYSSSGVFREMYVALAGDFAAAMKKYSHNAVWIAAVANHLCIDAVMVEHAVSTVDGKLLRFASAGLRNELHIVQAACQTLRSWFYRPTVQPPSPSHPIAYAGPLPRDNFELMEWLVSHDGKSDLQRVCDTATSNVGLGTIPPDRQAANTTFLELVLQQQTRELLVVVQ